jgi:hypothetical protein
MDGGTGSADCVAQLRDGCTSWRGFTAQKTAQN